MNGEIEKKIVEEVGLPRWYRRAQLLAGQISVGCVIAFFVIRMDSVKEVLMPKNPADFNWYALTSLMIVGIGIVSIVVSGGTGLINETIIRRFLKAKENETND